MATKRIQGITVEIGGDTSKLTAALKDVDKSLSTTQSNLRDVNKLLKLDPGNTELLTQKHKLLADAVSETKERLATLKTAAEQANQALANGEISQTQYDALQREIIETEEKLKNLEKQAAESSVAMQKLALTGEKMKNLGDNISGVGTKLMPLTGAIAALGTAAVKTAADFDSAMSQVAAISGATGEDLQALRDKAREMGENTKFSATEAAEAMNYMAMAGWKTSDMLSGIEGIMNLAAASGEDLATTSDIVTDALTAFGLTAADSGHFADILAAASSNANTNVSMMGETFKYCAPIAGALGFSAEDTAEAIGLMANAGIKSTQAGTALRTIMNNLAGEVKFSGAAFGEMTVQTVNADGSMRDLNAILTDCRNAFSKMSESEKAANAETMVGKNAMSGFLAIMNAGQADIDKLSGAIDNCDGSAGKMAETMQDNLQGQLTILMSQLQELAISFGEMLMPVIREIVTLLQGFVDKLNNMDEGTRNMILKIALFVAALGPVLIIVGKVISAIGTILTIVPKIAAVINVAKGAFAALNVVMMANPIGLVIAAIAALIAIFVLLWNNCDGFREFWINLWENIKSGVSKAVTAIGDFISKAWQGIKDVTSKIWSGIKDLVCGYFQTTYENNMKVAKALAEGISSAWNWLSENTSKAWSNIKEGTSKTWESIKESTSQAWESIRTNHENICRNIAEGIINTWTSLKESTAQLWSGIKDTVCSIGSAISDTVRNLWQGIKDTTESIHNAIKNVVDNVLSGINNLYESFSSTVKNIGSSLWEGIKNVFQSGLDFVHDLVTNKLSSLVTSIGDFFSNILSGITSKLASIQSAVSNCLSSLTSGLSNAMGNITSGLSNAFSNIKGAFSNLVSNAFGWGKDLIGNMISGIGSMIGNLIDKVKDIAGTIADYLHFTEPDKGPLSNFHTYMPDMIDLLGKGIEDNLSKLKGPMTALGNTMIPAMGTLGIETESSSSGTQSNAKLEAMTDMVLRYLPKMANTQIVLDSGTLVGELSDGMNRQLGKAYL